MPRVLIAGYSATSTPSRRVPTRHTRENHSVDLAALRTPDGEAALAAAADLAGGDPLHAAAALRSAGVPPDLAAAALTQATLRRQAAAKFGPEAECPVLHPGRAGAGDPVGGGGAAGPPAGRRGRAHPGRPGLRHRFRRDRRRPGRDPGRRCRDRRDYRGGRRRQRRRGRRRRPVPGRTGRRDGLRHQPVRRRLLRPGPPLDRWPPGVRPCGLLAVLGLRGRPGRPDGAPGGEGGSRFRPRPGPVGRGDRARQRRPGRGRGHTLVRCAGGGAPPGDRAARRGRRRADRLRRRGRPGRPGRRLSLRPRRRGGPGRAGRRVRRDGSTVGSATRRSRTCGPTNRCRPPSPGASR